VTDQFGAGDEETAPAVDVADEQRALAVDLADVDEANRAPGGRAKAVLSYLARHIVEDPDGVSVEVSETRGGVRLELFVADGDMGRVIGRKGRVAQSIRAVVRAAGARDGLNVTVDIVD
jgi:predicted RNA-binding protein YlqC (UPF0109 family)